MNFTINGQRIDILDLDAERGGKRKSSHEHEAPFAEYAREEAETFQSEHKFLTVYSEYFVPQSITDSEKTLKLCLTDPSYVTSFNRRKLRTTNVLVVFVNKNGNYLPLWELHRLKVNKCYLFLDKVALEKELRQVFEQVDIKLGKLIGEGLPCIAWQFRTEDGIFYIPWHNGCVIEDCESFTFEEKPFEELRKTYALLKFVPYSAGAYQTICC